MRRLLIASCYVIGTMALAVAMIAGWGMYCLYRNRWPEEGTHGNCWSFALPKWLPDPVGTYLVISKSKHAPVLHVRFAPSIEGLYVEEAKPARPRRGLRGVMDSFWFKWRIRKGRGEE